ncbi:MAG: glutamine-hydrolyzing carbamoyl-phosphate synthase small subunit [Rhodothermales bacterium]|nr:glutamine-hydrolyzing carbamoyl-phosphate synthase small subunit [Rhodothermales bacterium]MDG2017039.1 glutamine-hydrolyzing carbamoyl-phosphate synthase small subunit [Rhodothermales bacterium]
MINSLENNQLLDAEKCKIALADGTVVTGTAIGYRGETGGELCFNTSMSGYQEIFTDPSYHGQIMMMTYPHIGNYGTMDIDMEASRPMVSGVVVRAFSQRFSNQHADQSLDAFMKEHKLVGISEVDTRRLVLHIRSKGVMNAVISSIDLDDDSLVAKAKAWPSMEGFELASRVTVEEAYDFARGEGPRVAVFDYGVKQNILRSFKSKGCTVRVFPAATELEEVLSWNPDGIFFSNGPGDPRAMPDSIETVKAAMQTDIPLFGICLGHQLLSLAAGLEVYKMRVGHRGANHPVQNLSTRHVEVSTQNHGFAVAKESLKDDIAELTHINLNDDTLEGIRFKACTAFSVQYHPEASPGPHDSHYLFDEFMNDILEVRGVKTTVDLAAEMMYAGR